MESQKHYKNVQGQNTKHREKQKPCSTKNNKQY